MPERVEGAVKWFSNERGYGFIVQDGGREHFVHYKNILMNGHRILTKEQRVSFEVEQAEKGTQAKEVKVI